MTRVKRGKIAHQKREKLLRQTKGFRWGRKSKERAAREALLHALSRSFRGRKEKKRNFRRLFEVKINAACREGGIPYSRFMAGLRNKNIKLDRKILADLAVNNKLLFKELIVAATK